LDNAYSRKKFIYLAKVKNSSFFNTPINGMKKSIQSQSKIPEWTFFTNHTHILVFLALNGDATLREAALSVGITERSAQRIVQELEDCGVLKRKKIGRCNKYSLNRKASLRHPLERHCTIGQILDVILNQRD
jgi:predicted transcriptional regulator